MEHQGGMKYRRFLAMIATSTAGMCPRGEEAGEGESFEAELVLLLAGPAQELGYHGFSTCDGGVRSQPGTRTFSRRRRS